VPRTKQEVVPLRRVLGGVADPSNVQWLAELYDQYSDHVYDIIIRHGGPAIDAEDIVHDVFLIARRKIDLLRTYADPGGWLHLTALHEVWRARRRVRLRRLLSFGLAPPPPDPNSQEASFIEGETARWVYSTLDKLPLKQREALVLFHLEGLTSVEIGRLLGCPEETIRSRIFHGKRAFMKAVERRAYRRTGRDGSSR